MKRGLRITVILLFLCLLLTFTVSANSPPSAELEGGGFGSAPMSLIAVFICASVALTVLIEWLVSLLFRLRAASVVIVTNVISQLVMHVLFLLTSFLTFFGLRPIFVIAFFEVAVFFCEWAVYIAQLPNQSRGKLFLFTLTANLLSLAVGGFIIYFIL